MQLSLGHVRGVRPASLCPDQEAAPGAATRCARCCVLTADDAFTRMVERACWVNGPSKPLRLTSLSSCPTQRGLQVAQYHRRGHWRKSTSGTIHWVSGHTVNRLPVPWLKSSRSPLFRVSSPPRGSGDTPPSSHSTGSYPPGAWETMPRTPNAICPLCKAPVWFFRDEFGGCAYFNLIGPPWPKHPCMDIPHSAQDRRAEASVKTAYTKTVIGITEAARRLDAASRIHSARTHSQVSSTSSNIETRQRPAEQSGSEN